MKVSALMIQMKNGITFYKKYKSIRLRGIRL
jgi:hypothetical protein